MKLKKIISILLVVISLFCVCSFSSYASDEGTNLDISTFNISQVNVLEGTGITDYSSTVSVVNSNYIFTSGVSGIWFKNTNANFYNYNATKTTALSSNFKIYKDHNYTVTFSTEMSSYSGIPHTVYSTIWVYDGNGNVANTITLYEKTNCVSSVENIHTFDFNLSDSDLPSGYSLKLAVTLQNPRNSGNQFYIAVSDINIVDNDDDSSWFQKIINAIINLPSNISGFFTSLGDRIGNFFTTLSTNIRNYFSSLGDRIRDFFTTLKNYLLYFQDPVTLNSSGVLVNSSGKPVYTNPFQSSLDTIETTVYGWLDTIENWLDTIDTSKQNVSSYLNNGTTLINGILTGVPALALCLTFGTSIIVIRKVVGR